MIKRIIDISEQAYLHTDKKQLLIDRDGETMASVPIEDLGGSDSATSGYRYDPGRYPPLPAKQCNRGVL